MRIDLNTPDDLDRIPKNNDAPKDESKRRILTGREILEMTLPKVEYAVDPLITKPGLWLMNGSQKAGKTMFAAQTALSMNAGVDLMERFATGPATGAMFIEQDDPSGVGALQPILQRTTLPVDLDRFYSIAGSNFQIEPGFIEFLEKEITARGLGVVVLDSYTALRGPRNGSSDLVKAESLDLGLLDALAKRTGCLILLIHHSSKGSAALDWSDRSAGTYAMGAHSEGQVFISRFQELPGNAPERLVQIRGRHVEGAEMVIRFNVERLSYDFVLEGPAASSYPTILQMKSEFGTGTFSPKNLCGATGMSKASAHRIIGRLMASNLASKVAFGEYRLALEIGA